MAFCLSLIPENESDKSFLVELYTSARAEEMAAVPWSNEQKQEFLKMQSDAQNLYYRENYPNASFDIIKLHRESVGRFYLAELADEIRIIDIAILPRFFDRNIFSELIKKVLQKAQKLDKFVQIYLESFNPQAEIFSDLGFRKSGEHGIYFLWRYTPALGSGDSHISGINV